MDILNNFKTIHSFISGIFSKSEREYELTFVQDPDGRWYIDIPWDGNRSNLEMVAGSDKLLSHIAKGDNKVTLQVILDYIDDYNDYIILDRFKHSLAGGASYTVSNAEFKEPIWICPVTLCVLGRYPKKIYFKRIA
ncbi:MAG: DUF6717 family protein [Candidatus Limisoma sp.]